MAKKEPKVPMQTFQARQQQAFLSADFLNTNLKLAAFSFWLILTLSELTSYELSVVVFCGRASDYSFKIETLNFVESSLSVPCR